MENTWIEQDIKNWCSNALKNEKNQKELQEKVSTLLLCHFKDKGEYAREKFIKCFTEPMIYLENSLLRKNNIHPDRFSPTIPPEEYIKKYQEVEATISSEIKRLFRNFNTFL